MIIRKNNDNAVGSSDTWILCKRFNAQASIYRASIKLWCKFNRFLQNIAWSRLFYLLSQNAHCRILPWQITSHVFARVGKTWQVKSSVKSVFQVSIWKSTSYNIRKSFLAWGPGSCSFAFHSAHKGSWSAKWVCFFWNHFSIVFLARSDPTYRSLPIEMIPKW